MKFVSKDINQKTFDTEYKKAASDKDLFLLFATSSSNVSFRSGDKRLAAIVDRENFRDYFGPFAGRAFISFQFPPDVNSSPSSVLQTVRGIGSVGAGRIIQERNKKPFTSIEDCIKRTRLKKVIGKKCVCSVRSQS